MILSESCVQKSKPDKDGHYKWLFNKPWDTFTQDARMQLESTLVSFKQNLRVLTKTTNEHYKFVDGKKILVKQEKGDHWAIRKSLHKDTVYGKINFAKTKIGKRKILYCKSFCQ